MDGSIFAIVLFIVGLLIATWVAGAIYYDVGRASKLGGLVAVSWFLLVVFTLVFWQPNWQPFTALLVFLVFFLGWWSTQRPSNDRKWAEGFTQLATVQLEGDTVSIDNVRNSDYPTTGKSETKYETRRYRLSKLKGVDALILYWGSSLMSHPMFVFDFGSDGRICMSIEVRYLDGHDYNFIGSIFRQNELIYIVSDERDAILRRTKFQSGQEVYLYKIQTTPLGLFSFFFEYANSINALAEKPRWYNGLTKNCTTSIYAQGRGRMQWDWKMLFNGALDRLMYDRKLLDQNLSFETLKERSRVNDVTEDAPVDGFGDHIRQKLAGYNSPKSAKSDNASTQKDQKA